jgi:hypothetical protein
VFSRRSLFVLGAALFLVAGVMGNFDATLRQMHVPGGASGGVTTVASPLTSAASAESLQQSWRAWDDYVGNLPPGSNVAGYDRVRTRPGTIVAIWLVVDSLLFAPLLWLLLIGAGARRARIKGPWEHWLDAMWLIATVYLVADEVENILTAMHIFHHWPAFVLVRIASGVKLAFLVTAALPIVLSLVRPGAAEPDDIEPIRHLARRYRVPLVMTGTVGAILLFLPSSVRPQIADVVRTWTPGDHLDGLWWATGLIVVFTACVWLAGVVAADVARGSATARIVDTKYIVHNAVGIVVVAGTTLTLKIAGVDFGFPLGFVVAAAWAFNLGGVTAIAPGSAPVRPAEDFDSRRALACIAALPALFVSALVLRSAELVQRNQATLIALLVASLGFAVFCVLVTTLPKTEVSSKVAIAALAGIGGAALLLAVWVLTALVQHSWNIGTVGLLVLALIVVTVLFGLLGILRRPPNGALALLRIKRPPILIGVVAVYLLTGAFNQTIGFHKVRTLGTAVGRETVDERHSVDLTRAVSTAAAAKIPAVTAPGTPVTPLFVIVSSGGGGRAAYWTLLATDCLFSAQTPAGVTTSMPECSHAAPWGHVFAASGISGGSVGLAMYAAERARPGAGTTPVDAVFDQGFVDPDVASMLFVDLPNGLVTHDAWPDRAAALEEA